MSVAEHEVPVDALMGWVAHLPEDHPIAQMARSIVDGRLKVKAPGTSVELASVARTLTPVPDPQSGERKVTDVIAAALVEMDAMRGRIEPPGSDPRDHYHRRRTALAEKYGLNGDEMTRGLTMYRLAVRSDLATRMRWGFLLDVMDTEGIKEAYRQYRQVRTENDPLHRLKEMQAAQPKPRPASPNQVGMIVAQARGLSEAAVRMTVGDLDETDRKEWARSLRDAIKGLRYLEQQIKGKREEKDQ